MKVVFELSAIDIRNAVIDVAMKKLPKADDFCYWDCTVKSSGGDDTRELRVICELRRQEPDR